MVENKQFGAAEGLDRTGKILQDKKVSYRVCALRGRLPSKRQQGGGVEVPAQGQRGFESEILHQSWVSTSVILDISFLLIP